MWKNEYEHFQVSLIDDNQQGEKKYKKFRASYRTKLKHGNSLAFPKSKYKSPYFVTPFRYNFLEKLTCYKV